MLGLSGVAADIARREKRRLQYYKMKNDPHFVARRTEYRKKYRMRRKLLTKTYGHPTFKAAAAAAATSSPVWHADSSSESSLGVNSAQVSDPQTFTSMSNSLHFLNPNAGSLGEETFLAQLPISGVNGLSHEGSSTPAVPRDAPDTCQDHLEHSEGKMVGSHTLNSSHIRTTKSRPMNLLRHLYRPAPPKAVNVDSPCTGNNLRGFNFPIKRKSDTVSIDKYLKSQRMCKRTTSKLIYYQSVIRRDRAIIAYLKEELERLGQNSDVSMFKLPDYRLKRLDNPAEDVIIDVDSAEDKTYRRYVEEVLNNPNLNESLLSGKLKSESCTARLDDGNKSPLDTLSQTANCSSHSTLQIENDSCGATPVLVNGERIKNPSSVENKMISAISTCPQTTHMIAKSLPKKAQKKSVHLAIVKLKKATVSNSACSSDTVTYEVTKKRQVAVKSTRGNVPRIKPRSKIKIDAPITTPTSYNTNPIQSFSYDDLESLRLSAIREGQAFARLRAKMNLSSDPLPEIHSTNPLVNSKTSHQPVNEGSTKRKASTSPSEKKKQNLKKIPLELRDEDYVPEVSVRLSSPVVSNEDVQVRDNDIYDIFLKCRAESLSETLGVCDIKFVPPNLREKVLKFVEDSTYLERTLYNCSNTEEGASADAELGDGKEATQLGLYRDQFIGLLHQRFLATHAVDCNLEMFAKCLPHSMVRKSAIARGFSSCLTCGSAEILFENLVEHNVIHFKGDFETTLVDKKLRASLMASLDRVSDPDRQVSCLTWMKSMKGNFARSLKSVQETAGDLISSFKDALARLDEHLDGVNIKYCVMRAALARCQLKLDEAMVHVTWCENPKVYSRSPGNHITVDQNISILSGYVWTAEKEYSFTSLSDQRDHSTSVLWSHLQEALSDVVLMGYTKLFVVSDPPINQFRNKVNFYYMNEFAVKNNAQIRWLFSASYHTYLTADVTGLYVKELIEKTTHSNVKKFGHNYHQSAAEIISMLRPLTDTRFYLATKEDIDANVSSLPYLQSIKGTQTFAEVLIAPGKFYVKLNSADEHWTKVLVVF
ncbi:uncharacterized protein LOC108683002 isoform X2 [Hyalella azteca]|uniref:Uncharacterized protein LOC108683002 isoform X2 n=1 Tax=Hyalella azteca TaxID=294128 RepID=A0A8B7PNI4_HYAAZ|nr:uncharacterized protein LOC108683002 isoform X2 [Hyalella azteca]